MTAARDLQPETHVYKTVDGHPIRLDVYPVDAPASPVLLCIHGGALISGTRRDVTIDGARFLTERCAEARYTQVSIDYRLAPETKLAGILEDVRDAWAWMHSELPSLADVDTTRTAVLGRSAGGYLALMAGFCVEPPPRAVVSLYGYGDIAGAWYAEPSPFYLTLDPIPAGGAYDAVGSGTVTESEDPARWRFYLYCRQHGLWIQEVAGLDPERDGAELRRYRPICNVTSDYPPTLLLHGTADTDVPYEQSVEMAAALQAHGVAAELVTIPDGVHAFDERLIAADVESPNRSPAARTLDRILRFLEQHVR
jgi:acetyl esterase/lipase